MDIYPRTVPDAAHVVDNDGSLVKTLPPTAKLDQWQLRDLVGYVYYRVMDLPMFTDWTCRPTRSWTMVRGIRLIIDVLPIEVCSPAIQASRD